MWIKHLLLLFLGVRSKIGSKHFWSCKVCKKADEEGKIWSWKICSFVYWVLVLCKSKHDFTCSVHAKNPSPVHPLRCRLSQIVLCHHQLPQLKASHVYWRWVCIWNLGQFWGNLPSRLLLGQSQKRLVLVQDDRLVGLVVRRLPQERKVPGSNPACAGIFSGSSHTCDLNIGTPVATLPGAWHYRISAGTGQPGVRILWLGEMESLIHDFCLSVAAREIEQIRPRDTRMLLGC